MNGSRTIKLSNGSSTLVSAEDYEKVKDYTWRETRNGYAITSIGGRLNKREILMHRLITGAVKGEWVDHKNHNKLDNRRDNLRLCTASQNIGNSNLRADNTSGYKGVTLHTINGNWISRIMVEGKTIHLGVFDNPHDAARMYNFWALDIFGEFAKLNVVEEAAV